jgi:AcrR family transcriptional regulator
MASDLRALRTAQTRQRILAATRRLLGRHGDATLDAVAAQVGVSKQSVLYHFGSKERLFGELALELITAEAAAMVEAVQGARGVEVLRRFARANLAWHCANFDRLRLSYLRSQIAPGARDAFTEAERAERMVPHTARMYDALEQCVRAGADIAPALDVRRLVVAVHLAALGFATMAGTLEAVGTSFRQPLEAYLDTLLDAVVRGASEGETARKSSCTDNGVSRKRRAR